MLHLRSTNYIDSSPSKQALSELQQNHSERKKAKGEMLSWSIDLWTYQDETAALVCLQNFTKLYYIEVVGCY